MVLLVAVVGAFYAMQPEKAEAKWDFNRGTGNWVNHGDYSSCVGSWWNNECRGTQGIVIHRVNQ